MLNYSFSHHIVASLKTFHDSLHEEYHVFVNYSFLEFVDTVHPTLYNNVDFFTEVSVYEYDPLVNHVLLSFKFYLYSLEHFHSLDNILENTLLQLQP